jgi:16S rRNA (cytosine1402-N4)-methyltransferase
MTSPSHVPVLLDRVVALVAPALQRTDREQTLLVDATLGLGGHTEAVLQRCPQAHVIGVDRDVHALERSRERLAPYGGRVTFVPSPTLRVTSAPAAMKQSLPTSRLLANVEFDTSSS